MFGPRSRVRCLCLLLRIHLCFGPVRSLSRKVHSSTVTAPKSLPPGCRLDCPAGWLSSKRDPTSRCYFIPKPVDPDVDTMWNMQAKCKKNEPSAHVLMIGDLLEQSTTTAVANNFGPKWKKEQPDGFLWLGAYADSSGWHSLEDGSDASGNLLMAMANMARAPGSSKNGTCLAADLITAGSWFTVPCDRNNGLAVCEMPKKQICGNVPAGDLIDSPELSTQELMVVHPNLKDFLGKQQGRKPEIWTEAELSENSKETRKERSSSNAAIAIGAHRNLIPLESTPGGSGNPTGSQASTTKPESTTKSANDSACPLACPEGWVRFAFSENCYKLPAQPANLDTFWSHERRCKEMEPTSYIAVMNSLAEQAVATPVAVEYAANWFAVLTNGFIWLGGYTDQKGWKFLDGTDQTGSVLMIGTNIIGSQKNDTCLGADPKTLGLWQTRPCTDKTGVAICEMPRRRVCGKTGGILPISPINLTPASLANLPSIPYIGQIIDESALDNAMTGAGSALACWLGGECKSDGGAVKPTQLPAGCRLDCPAGWLTWNRGPTSRCYLIPKPVDPDVDTMWNMQAKCRKNEPSAQVLMIGDLLEQSTTTAVANNFGPMWKKEQPDGFLWLGAYADSSGWHSLEDGSDASGNLLMAMANMARAPGSSKNGTCLAADLTTAGSWFTVPCDRKNGLAICEMPKKQICGNVPVGDLIDFRATELTPQLLKQLFSKAPEIPFLAEVLEGRSQSSFNPSQAAKNNETGLKYGDSIVIIICAKGGTSLVSSVNSVPDWIWLKVNGQQATATGQWAQVKCKGGKTDVFKVQPITYLSAWVRCYNKGYDLAMPAQTIFSGWYPFQVNDKLALRIRCKK